ncbi:hypothetical protein ARMSODRAFT_1090369 [Armillaria solidipes]|uniref:Uncharacterized protein n=1 Tax=Armillaria solidipes TaxID=1076256 RepID=A0A2H3AUK1_9AGAR|nr:hypothetical protein ARMSODRAFT_1090369 [Armillaria solidipes]
MPYTVNKPRGLVYILISAGWPKISCATPGRIKVGSPLCIAYTLTQRCLPTKFTPTLAPWNFSSTNISECNWPTVPNLIVGLGDGTCKNTPFLSLTLSIAKRSSGSSRKV